MAKKKSFTDVRGVTYPESYWRITAISVDVEKRIARFTFSGYRDAAARNDNKAIVGRKIISSLASDFVTRYTDHIQNGTNLAVIGYQLANDTLYPTGETEPVTRTIQVPSEEDPSVFVDQEIAEQVPVRRPFFHGGEDVL